jgi:uncharacterized protein
MSATAAPPDLKITPRDVAFGRGQQHPRWWLGGDPVATAFFNALSLTFPQGEAFFVKSVRRYLDELPEPLRSQVADFAQQEAYHSREHLAFNRQVSGAGYDTRAIDDFIREDIRIAREESAEVNLAVTAALEHFTAILARALLSDERHFADCAREIRRLWKWHSIEEIEHKGVAFDTFHYVTRKLPPIQRWIFRVLVMRRVTSDFWSERVRDLHVLFQQDGIDTRKTWRRLVTFLLLRPGLLRQILIPYLRWYLPGFHPWSHDDRALAAKVESELMLSGTARAA